MRLSLAVGMMAIAIFPTSVDAQESNQDENLTSQSQWFESDISVDVRSSGTYVVSECTSIAGSACDSPGSTHRIDISFIMNIIW